MYLLRRAVAGPRRRAVVRGRLPARACMRGIIYGGYQNRSPGSGLALAISRAGPYRQLTSRLRIRTDTAGRNRGG